MRVKIREGATVGREIDGETVLLDLESSVYLGLNRTGTLLWPAMVAGTTEDALAEALVDAFGISADQAAADVAAFVTSCRARGLLEE